MDWITHEEDVWFEFRGSSPDELEPGRYYRGSVDGFAEFGVFVDLSDGVTGLLHKSELDKRMETLDWSAGDTVFVQVTGVRDNGDVDLGWSIRQEESEFRGSAVHDPDADDEADLEPEPREDDDDEPSVTVTRTPGGGEENQTEDGDGPEHEPDPEPEDVERVPTGALADRVGDRIAVEGRIVDAHQTSGPTVFELRDESGTVECAAFESAGVRAYPEVGEGDLVRLVGDVERHHGDLQVETETLTALDGEAADAVEARLESAAETDAEPETDDSLAEHPAVDRVGEELRAAATAVRRAVDDERPVVVRHSDTAEGYLAGAALERAVLPAVRDHHDRRDAQYHYFERRPLEEGVYDMDAATRDATDMLEANERHGEAFPLVVVVDGGSTRESTAGYDLLAAYGADRVVVDAGYPDEEVRDAVDAVVNPHLAGEVGRGAPDPEDPAESVTSAALAAELALLVRPEAREDLRHLPAASYRDPAPEAYADIAGAAGYEPDDLTRIREAVAVEAYYQSYEDKRELVEDVVFGDGEFATHLSEQYRERVETELETVRTNREYRDQDGVDFAVLDTEAYTHRFDFPPTRLLLDELHAEERADADDPLVTVGHGEDELRLRSTVPVDVRAVADRAADLAPDAAITVAGGRDGHLEFLVGEREAALDAAVEAVAAELSD